MVNQIKMAEMHAILTLRARGWPMRRIGRELGIHRENVTGIRTGGTHAARERPWSTTRRV